MHSDTNSTHAAGDLRFVDLGRIDYAAALRLQYETHDAVLAGSAPPTVYVLEHDPVITLTRRAAAGPNLLADPAALEADGVTLADTDRGGDVTYHGPGQLVVYPIIPLAPLGMNVRRYVCALEQAVIDTLGAFGVAGRRDDAGIGVWVDPARNAKLETRDLCPAKIAAIGVRIRRWITLHGLALNVTTNLAHFRHIVPCGLSQPVTSLARLLGEDCPTMQAVKDAAVDSLRRTLAGSASRCAASAEYK